MKSTKILNIEEECGYCFNNMTNITDFYPNLLIISEIGVFSSVSTMFEVSYNKESNTPNIVFNDIECVFKKSGKNKYLIFCKTK